MLLGLSLCVSGLSSECFGEAQNSSSVVFWDFARGLQGWEKSPAITSQHQTPEGVVLTASTEDPYLVSSEISLLKQPFALVTLRMRSTGDTTGQIYYGTAFAEERSRTFRVKNDNKWHNYQIWVPNLFGKTRIRLDPSRGKGVFTLASLRVETTPNAPTEAWAQPQELRSKKIIGSGQYSINGGESAVTSRFLAKHPDFLATFPFDGYVVPVVIGQEWAEKWGLPRRDYFLHELLWNRIEIPYEAIKPAVADLKSVRWGHCTDNFLNVTLADGAKGRFTPDLANEQDWEIIERNVSLAARLCREAKLQGFWFDTEQYGAYRWSSPTGTPELNTSRPTNLKFPFGKDTTQLLRQRGAQWIRAIQAQMPEVKILITFAWSPDANGYGALQGVTAFLNGVLDGIRAPGKLIHGYENTFYYGQGPGTTNVVNDGRKEGYPGGRERYEQARQEIRDWRQFSSNPAKFDKFVKVGMAAWVEDDPWNNWSGAPSGHIWSFWSNLALALAYSDEYVWVWSEHTHYGHGFQAKAGTNPFLASLSNQTFNTGREEATTLSEDFSTDPLRHGWYFDFDMLDIAKRRNPSHAVALMNPDAVPYAWSAETQALQVDGVWQRGARNEVVAPPNQRRRYVHPIVPIYPQKSFRVEMDFRIASFGSSASNAMILGLFKNDKPHLNQSLTLQMRAANHAYIVLTAQGKTLPLPLMIRGGLKIGENYRVTFEYDTGRAHLLASLNTLSKPMQRLAHIKTLLPKTSSLFGWDEVGVALPEPPLTVAPHLASRYLLKRVFLFR